MKKLPKLHLACSNDYLRPSMQYIWIYNGYATATDGHILVRYNLNDIGIDGIEFLHDKYIHRDEWNHICKADSVSVHLLNDRDDIELCMHFEEIELHIYVSNSPGERKYPDVDNLINRTISKKEANQTYVAVDPELITRLKRIMHHPYRCSFVIKLLGNKTGMIVTPDDDIDAFAIVMPMVIPEDKLIEDKIKIERLSNIKLGEKYK